MTENCLRSEKRENIRKGVYLLPNLITAGGIFAGFYVIIAATDGNYERAAWFILLAAIFDGLDGKVARLTGTSSKFGVELDSLADVISFGVAPGVLLYLWALRPFGKLGWLAAFLYVICGALRLARFNVQVSTVESRRFVGMPIPAAACIVATCVLLFYELGGTGTIKMVSMVFLVFLLAFLLVSNIEYLSLKDPDLFKRQPFVLLVVAIMLLIVIVAKPQIMLFLIGIAYLLSGPIGFYIGWRKNRQNGDHSTANES
ncbi:CDP-diacylglycerol--serine O-phosphatidyltransferase [Desulfuromusa kysingii]|uniref:CDP-diacylglycerol--serine O-phosphatidyltransferase n=1 Tax=Desulfuromusa kysingii TaxID=37625 RepID=A0A1H3Y8K8_9BACT|nr:CDP-diacylglycerol--serine O-phosphatidyltransferase [Desulfuromusa kysingii]SEA07870.1 CDP-diacylglycerol--serine O-phosphatidyltransferase [Desulfuromusa kysingii]